ncbi:MAG: hypothetical protein IJI38_01415 [Clostridia bacterium]|nr:hypothetical protein [Clostridia bacterium]
MSIIRKLMKLLGIRTRAQRIREKEIHYRTRLKKLSHHAQSLERKAEAGRMEAYRLEKNGEHDKAVRVASQAMNSANIARTVNSEVQKYEMAHDKAESMQLIRESYELMNEAGEMVTDMADIQGFEKVKAKNEEMQLRMEQTNEQLEMISEGVSLDTDEEVRNESGEAALREIMAQFEGGRKEKEQEKVEALPEAEERRAWAESRREALRDMVAEG